MKHIVIVGGGFAGVYTAKNLLKKIKGKEYHITLISEHNYFIFTPMLHEIATGSISRDNAVTAIHQIINHPQFTFIKAKVKNVDTKAKCVEADVCKKKYDFLVLATGSVANYYTLKGAEQHTLALRDLASAYKMRNKIIGQIERADVEKDQKKRQHLLTFIIVGGGSTGVEVAGELAQFIQIMIKNQHKNIKSNEVKLILIHRHERILNMLPGYYSKQCEKQLKKLRVSLYLDTDVQEVGNCFVIDQQKHKIEAGTIFWAVGFQPNTVLLDKKSFPVYPVDPFLRVLKQKDIFALGDCAFVDQGIGKRIPMLAQVATQQAKIVAHNILATYDKKRSMKPYVYKLQGFLLSVGDYFGVAGFTVGKTMVYFSGFFAWFVWRTIYLSKLIGFGNKVRVAVDWTLNFFYPRDTSEIE